MINNAGIEQNVETAAADDEDEDEEDDESVIKDGVSADGGTFTVYL